MEIEFYFYQSLDQKKNAGGKIWTWHILIENQHPRKHGHQGFTFHLLIFDDLLQLSSNLKFAKAELYLIGGCQDEWFELTYYIETLGQLWNVEWNSDFKYLRTTIFFPFHPGKYSKCTIPRISKRKTLSTNCSFISSLVAV